MSALDAILDAKRHRSVMDYRCGIDDCGSLLARLHPTAEGRLLLVAYGRVWRFLDPDDDVTTNPFVVDGWGDLTDQQRRDAEWVRAAELVVARDVRDPMWAVRSYARLVRSQSRAAAGRDRGEILEAAWFDGDGAITVSCRRHRIRALPAADARRITPDPHRSHGCTALIV